MIAMRTAIQLKGFILLTARLARPDTKRRKGASPYKFYERLSRSAFASIRSGVANPSVNQE